MPVAEFKVAVTARPFNSLGFPVAACMYCAQRARSSGLSPNVPSMRLSSDPLSGPKLGEALAAQMRCTGLEVSGAATVRKRSSRSEEHTSELQSLRHLVCR